MFKITVDLDGTICHTKKENEKYEDVLPIDGAIESLKALKEKGYYIIICTARNMKTCNNNLGKVIKNQAEIVTTWLKKYDVPYDELLFGKSHCDFFIDDKNIEFKGDWEEIINRLKKEEEKVNND